ncbi:MAG: type IV pilin protein [Steroidobacteraceae bacterium]
MIKQTTPSKAAMSGYTLIEILVALAIVAILASVAVAAYTSEVQKSRRTDARSALLDLAGREEKLFSTTNAYSATPSDLGYAPVGTPFPITVGSGYYQVSVAAPDPNQAAGSPTYSITATAIGTQANDSQCLTLSVNQLGAQTSTGTGTASTCWQN